MQPPSPPTGSTTGPTPGPTTGPSFAELEEATAHLDPPFAVIDLAAFDRNAATLVERAGGKPVRLATKSVRSRELIRRALGRPGYAGALAFALPEALWLADEVEDVLVGYPTDHRAALEALAADEAKAARVTLMVDSTDHLDRIEAVVGRQGPPVRICLDLDASLRLLNGRVHLGVRRSPLHDPADLQELARAVVARERFRLVGVMCYEGQIAGLADEAGSRVRSRAVKAVQRASAEELRRRRKAAVDAVREVADLEFVNGGGTGSLEGTAAEDVVTDVAAGSGLFGPTLFDHYSAFRPEPAAFFALSVVRRPTPRHATVLGGGWVASGPAGKDRLPVPCHPSGLELVGTEGAGEVQTPVTGKAAADLRVGDRVWFRHAKAGELCEHVDTLHLVEAGAVIGAAPTYRGEGRTFL
jgi:D-serine deaminase-like pyridoxal phosphate-dependent protein